MLTCSPTSAFKNTDTDATVYPEDGNSMAVLYDLAISSRYQSISEAMVENWVPIGAVCPEGHPDNIVPFPEGLEVKAHLLAREPQRALDLIRRSWGWYLDNPYGTGSTMIEGYLSDGSFKYANDGYNSVGSYPSHAHGWSAGPADALMSYVVGLRLESPGGRSWILDPQMGDLNEAQGGFTTPLGKFSSGWQITLLGYILWLDTPKDTEGTLSLPNKACKSVVIVDGAKQRAHCNVETSITTMHLKGGLHKILVSRF